MPEFDNLYLDMNSILHTCTHSNDNTLTRMTEDQMYAAIFNYIDHLFDIIKPKEVFYMAIDGVAPRAKMNQQRARRFRTAFEAEENLKKAINQGLDIPKEDPFDSNAITPGTEFMAKLTTNLKYFIHKKMTEDARWLNVKVILLGHEVPGEGEHKIMQFIRTMKSQDDYNPNIRHCIYGLDADLIMLGLVTHDPHFSLLREEVTFGPGSQNKSGDVHNQKFYLLHLSLLREYMALEFEDLEGQIGFEYSFERILDDFILIMYVIGNDFLPHLPDLHINKGAFPLLIGAFKQSLLHMDGYINDGGVINFKRLGVYLEYLSEFELDVFESKEVDVDWFNHRLEDISKSGSRKRERTGKLLILKDERKLVLGLRSWLLDISSKHVLELLDLANTESLPTYKIDPEDAKAHLEFLKTFALEAGVLIVHLAAKDTYELTIDVDGISPHEDEEEYKERAANVRKVLRRYQSANTFATEELEGAAKDLYNEKFVNFKDGYYKDKLHFSIKDADKMTEFTRHYLEGLQWVLFYYYKGCRSWNWFYKYHYAPRISDIAIGIKDMIEKDELIVKFDQAKPFRPFEQLMAVLPARSRKLIPEVYRPLMTDEHSPIRDFYPHEVAIDLNGKTASWEAVVLLDFVDENRLLEALKPYTSKLNAEETRRNAYGKDILFIYNAQADGRYPTPLAGFFHDLENDKCYEETFELPELNKEFKFTLPAGAKLGKELLAGFPSLYTIPFTAQLKLLEVKVFNYPSRSETMNLTLSNIWNDVSINQFAQKFLGKVVHARWPFLIESRVSEVWDSENKYIVHYKGTTRRVVEAQLTPDEQREFYTTSKQLTQKYQTTKAIKTGPIFAIVFVQQVSGLVRNSKGAYVKSFNEDVEPFPIQLIVEEVVNADERLAYRPPVPIGEEFPVGLPVIFLGAFAYGAPSTIASYTEDKLNVRIDKIQSELEPNIGKKRLEIENKEIRYLTSYEVAKLLKVNGLFLSKITGSYMVRDSRGSRMNVGLEMKFDAKRLKVLGFTRKSGRFWEYSPLAIQAIKDYIAKFPKLFNNLATLKDRKDMPLISEFSTEDEVKSAVKWLKSIKSDMMQVSLESDSLTKFSITAIENYMEDYIRKPLDLDRRDVKGVPREAVLHPSVSYLVLGRQRFDLGDRVIYVQDSGKVPKLSKGTVVNIQVIGNKVSLGVLFDQPLVGGNNMNGKLKSNRGSIIDSSLVLNLTNRQLVFHSKASKSKKPLTDAEKAKRAQLAQESKARQQQAEQAKKTHVNAKKANELLALLKKTPEDKDELRVEPAESSELKTLDMEAEPASNTVKHIYGQIYSNVMSHGAPPIPVVPGVPLPPQYFANPPPPQMIPQGPQGQPVPQGPGPYFQGQGGFDGLARGGRGNYQNGRGRGRGRGAPRGRGRGRGAPVQP